MTQTVGYGTLYYAYAVLLTPMAVTLGASTTAVTGALTASVLAGALAAVPVGRWRDRHGGRALMTAGSAAATALVLAWSQVRTLWQLYAVMVGIGVTGAMVLYEPAFAVLVSRFAAPRRDTALLVVTVVAGFASTIFLPLTGLLVDRLDWRAALVVLAAVHGLTAVPSHPAVVRRTPRDRPRPATEAPAGAVTGGAPPRLDPARAQPRYGTGGGPAHAGAVLGVVGFGVASLATPALMADRYGTAAYASIAGLLAAPVTVAKATAPLAAAAVLPVAGGHAPVLVLVAGCCALAAVGMLARAAAPSPLDRAPFAGTGHG